MSRRPFASGVQGQALLALLLAPSWGHAQESPPQAPLEQVRAVAVSDPHQALELLEALLTREDLPLQLQSEATLYRPHLLLLAGRRGEAERGWRHLMRRGEDVGQELLALRGVELNVELPRLVRPGDSPGIKLQGRSPTPPRLSLYRVDQLRWRAELERDRSRGMWQHLRAPASPTLRRVAQWQGEPLTPSGQETAPPLSLTPGLYLLTVEIGDVALPYPLLVSRALNYARRLGNRGLLYTADYESGTPLAGVEWWVVDQLGRPLELTQDPVPGLLRYGHAASWALGWTPAGGACLATLPSPAAGTAPSPLLTTDLPTYRPGQTLRIWTQGLPAAEGGALELTDPRGRLVLVEPLGAGLQETRYPLVPGAPSGQWQLKLGQTTRQVGVLPHQLPGLSFHLSCPETLIAPKRELAVGLTAQLPGGRPLGGSTVRWRLKAYPARMGGGLPGLLPPYALRQAEGDATQLGEGTTLLDEHGQSSLVIPIPTGLPSPSLLGLEASLEEGALRADALEFCAWGEADLLLAVEPEGRTQVSGALQKIKLRAARLDGTPAPGLELEFRVRQGATQELLAENVVRTNSEGEVTVFLAERLSGELSLQVFARDPSGRVASREAQVYAVGKRTPETATPRLIAEPGTPGQPILLTGLLPFPTGFALITCEGSEICAAQVLPIEGGVVRSELPPGELRLPRVRLVTIHGGRTHEISQTVEVTPPSLHVQARIVAYPAERQVILELQTHSSDGQPRAAKVALALYDEQTARLVARTEESGGAIPPATLSSFPVPLPVQTDEQGRVRIRLTLPVREASHWLRAEALDPNGSEGQSWLQLEQPALLAVQAGGPRTLIEGDQGRLTLHVSTRGVAGALGDDVLRVSWSHAGGLELGRPAVAGTQALLEGDPGPATLRLRAASDVLLSFPLRAATSGPANLQFSLNLENSSSAPVALEWPAKVRPRGRRLERVWTGSLRSQDQAEIRLKLPPGASPHTAALEVSVDANPATAALSGLVALSRQGGLRASLNTLALSPLRELLVQAHRLRLPPQRHLPAPTDPLAQIHATLAAARRPSGAWGEHTPALVESLLDLQDAGQSAPPFLKEALDWLASPQNAAPRARWLLARSGRLATPPTPATALTAEELFFHTLALRRLSPGVEAQVGLAALLERATQLEGVATVAGLLALLVEVGDPLPPELVNTLTERLYLARRGAGWAHPEDCAAAVRALFALSLYQAQGEAGVPASRVKLFLDGRLHQDDWSGKGLAEWKGVSRALSPAIGGRSRLRIEHEGPAPAFYSVRLSALAEHSPQKQSYRVHSVLLPALTQKPIGLAGVELGQRVRLQLELSLPPDERLEDLLLELPLPGGCRLLNPPPGSWQREGALFWEPTGLRLELELLATSRGEYRLLPAHLRSLRRPEREGWSERQRLKIR